MAEPKGERRRLSRRRTLKKARIIFNNRHSRIECVVRNLTAHGAILLLPNIVGVPDKFDLHIGGNTACHPARIVWKDADRMGVTWT